MQRNRQQRADASHPQASCPDRAASKFDVCCQAFKRRCCAMKTFANACKDKTHLISFLHRASTHHGVEKLYESSSLDSRIVSRHIFDGPPPRGAGQEYSCHARFFRCALFNPDYTQP
jgi:hypothetical protein